MVRRASEADVEPMAEVMARAFADDPLMAWVLPDADSRVHRMHRWFAAMYRRVALSHLIVYTTEPVRGVAEWAPPGGWRLPRRQAFLTLPATIRWLGGGAWRLGSAIAAMEARHPAEPHWYLGGLGTDPAHQRTGVASSLLRPVLEQCDAEGLPAYLETQSEGNVPFYGSHGFREVGGIDVPGGGPHLWLMWRSPR